MSVSVASPVFIGRRGEMASLAALLGRAQAREPAFALVSGEAGIGKTRLVREISAQAAEAGFVVLTGQCVELGAEGLPLAPLVDALRTLARSLQPEVLAGVLGPAGLGLARLLPELAPAAGAAGSAGNEVGSASGLAGADLQNGSPGAAAGAVRGDAAGLGLARGGGGHAAGGAGPAARGPGQPRASGRTGRAGQRADAQRQAGGGRAGGRAGGGRSRRGRGHGRGG